MLGREDQGWGEGKGCTYCQPESRLQFLFVIHQFSCSSNWQAKLGVILNDYVFFFAENANGVQEERIDSGNMTKPLNIEAPEFTPTRKVSKKTKQDLVASEAAEYYPRSLLREAVSIVNEKLKLDKKVE